MIKAALLVAVLGLALAATAQDPAQGWLAYATATCPAGTKITHMEAKWKVGQNPTPSEAFFSPWFGVEGSTNLNLLQPVNPWFGSSWNLYTEYFQWSPEYNRNSAQHSANAGDQLYGKVTFNGDAEQSYTLSQTDVTRGVSSSMTIPVQKSSQGGYKNYTIAYIVYEKVANCNQYPPDGKVTFMNIELYCNGQLTTPQWTTGVVDEVCSFKANIISPTEVSITWNPQGVNPRPEQFARNAGGLQRPKKMAM